MNYVMNRLRIALAIELVDAAIMNEFYDRLQKNLTNSQ